tara:strand:+ start:398 stop:1054 length:657 start_codon:yes stop_codon:yes gene_type:complete
MVNVAAKGELLLKRAQKEATGSTSVWILMHKVMQSVKNKAGNRHRHHLRGKEAARLASATRRERVKDDPDEKKKTKEYLEKTRVHRNEQERKRKLENPHKKVKALVLTRIHGALAHVGTQKRQKTATILGCSIEHYFNYIGPDALRLTETDKQIDHIWPLNLYDLTNEREMMKAFNWRNTRITPRVENRSKSDSPPEINLALTVPFELWPDRWVEFYD